MNIAPMNINNSPRAFKTRNSCAALITGCVICDVTIAPASRRRAVISMKSARPFRAVSSVIIPRWTAKSSPSAARRTSDRTRPRDEPSAISLAGIMEEMIPFT